jgi:hypothetical protein
MGFGDIFKNTGLLGNGGAFASLKPGSPEFKRMMGLAAEDNERIAAGDDDDEIILVSKAEYKRKTGVDLKSVPTRPLRQPRQRHQPRRPQPPPRQRLAAWW